MNRQTTAAGFATLLLFASVPALAEEPMTMESCQAYLMSDPSGPRIDPTNLQVGSEVFGEPVFAGMTIEYLCDRELGRQAELRQKDGVIANLREQLTAKADQEATQRNYYLRSRKHDAVGLIMRNPWDVLILSGGVFGAAVLALLWGPLMGFLKFVFKKRNVFSRNSIFGLFWELLRPKKFLP